jgi:hypothetical protein
MVVQNLLSLEKLIKISYLKFKLLYRKFLTQYIDESQAQKRWRLPKLVTAK